MPVEEESSPINDAKQNNQNDPVTENEIRQEPTVIKDKQ